MKPKTLLMMGVAVVCGLAAAVLANQLIAKNKETVKILVAKEKMSQWEVIKEPALKFTEEEILVTDAPKGVITADKIAELKDRTLRRPLEEKDKLTDADLQPKDKQSLEAQLEKGKRAWSVKITQESAAGGFILPGSRVDVWHISREGNRGNEAKLVLENVLVRAIGLTPVRPDDRPGIIDATATLELSPEQIDDLAKVQDIGMLRLSLRPYGDSTTASAELNKKRISGPIVEPSQPPPPPVEGAEQPATTPATTTTTDTTPPKAAETYTKTQTVFNGASWVQRVYTLDSKTHEILSSEIRQQSDAPKALEPKAEAKPAADDKSKQPEETTKS